MYQHQDLFVYLSFWLLSLLFCVVLCNVSICICVWAYAQACICVYVGVTLDMFLTLIFLRQGLSLKLGLTE